MIGSALDANPAAKGLLFDGFPRTEAQAEALDSLLASKGSEITLVLALEVGQEELVARLLNRGKTSARSDDRDENVIRKRLVEYAEKTAIVADYYAQFGKVAKVKGEGSIEEIFQSLCAKIEAKQPA
jgi:adenylate kinase